LVGGEHLDFDHVFDMCYFGKFYALFQTAEWYVGEVSSKQFTKQSRKDICQSLQEELEAKYECPEEIERFENLPEELQTEFQDNINKEYAERVRECCLISKYEGRFADREAFIEGMLRIFSLLSTTASQFPSGEEEKFVLKLSSVTGAQHFNLLDEDEDEDEDTIDLKYTKVL